MVQRRAAKKKEALAKKTAKRLQKTSKTRSDTGKGSYKHKTDQTYGTEEAYVHLVLEFESHRRINSIDSRAGLWSSMYCQYYCTVSTTILAEGDARVPVL